MPLLIKTTGFEDFLDPSGGAYLKVLIMGDHGVGKTPSACNWPKPILADCEKGRLSVASLAVPYADIKNSTDMEALLDMLRREGMKPAGKRAYETLVVDTFDTYQRKLIQERLKSERKESLSGWADWGWLDGKMQGFIEAILNLPMNVVVNLHTKDVSEDDGETQTLVQKARLKGDIKDSIFQDFDLIGHMEQSYVADPAKKGERKRVRQIRWHSEPKYPALRDRSNKLPRFTDVTFTGDDYWQIFNKITEGLDDLPKSTDVESLEIAGDDAVVPGPDTKGGPVEEPVLPQAKPAAKKAAPAKKATPAKKAAPAKKAEPEPEPEADPNVVAGKDFTPPEPGPATDVDPWTGKAVDEPAAEETPAATDVANDAEALLSQELGAEEITEPEPEPEPVVAAPKAEPAKAAADAPPIRVCGDQPASMVGKHNPVDGCGIALDKDNAKKVQFGVLKFRTYLCDEDLARQQQLAAS